MAHSPQIQAKIRRVLAVRGDLQVAISTTTGKVAIALVHGNGAREILSSEVIARPTETESDDQDGRYARTRWDALG